jgi:hypothetical protein
LKGKYCVDANDGMRAKRARGSRLPEFALFLSMCYYLPTILVWARIIPFKFRLHVLVTMTIIGIIYAKRRKCSWNDLGFRRDTLKGSLIWNLGLSLVFLISLCLMYASGLAGESTAPSWSLFFTFYVFISCPSQEFAYRSLLFAEMKNAGIENPVWQIAISSITFCFLHIIFSSVLNMVLTLFLGIIWGTIYQKHPNFWGVALSHAVLGVLSIANGIV